MNSLSSFEHHINPLQGFIQHINRNLKVPSNIITNDTGLGFVITLPNKKCKITINSDGILINRMNFEYEKKSQYKIKSVDEAKLIIGVLSGICHEYGCSYEEANNTAYLILQKYENYTKTP